MKRFWSIVMLLNIIFFIYMANEHPGSFRKAVFIAVLCQGCLFTLQLIGSRPPSQGTVHEVMETLNATGRGEEAIDIGEKILKDAPDDSRVQIDLLRAYIETGEEEKAEFLYAKIDPEKIFEEDRERFEELKKKMN